MPLTEPCLRISRTRLFSQSPLTATVKYYIFSANNTGHLLAKRPVSSPFSRARLDIRASFVSVGLPISVYGPHLLSSVRLTAGPFEWVPYSRAATGHYPGYASTMSRSDCRISMSPPCFFSLLRNASNTAIPSSDAIRWMTRYGLRPRHAVADLPSYACNDTGFRAKQPLAHCD